MTLDLPDVPRWVEAHGIAGEPDAWRVPLGRGFALGHDAARLVVVAGEADPSVVGELVRERPRHVVLFAIEREDLRSIAGACDRVVERAILHVMPDPARLPEPAGAGLLQDGAASLDHVPDAVAAELAWARARGIDVWAVWLDGRPVSFAYAPWRSAKWFDVSVDTLAGARQLGLATIVAAAMIGAERAQGREPVWGADEHNFASLALAKRLGFEPVDELWVAAAR